MYYHFRDGPLKRVMGVVNFRAEDVSEMTDNTDNSFDKKGLSNNDKKRSQRVPLCCFFLGSSD